jgi:hypothetical protein
MSKRSAVTAEKYFTAMSSMYSRQSYDPTEIHRTHAITAHLNSELKRLNRVAKIAPGEWKWIGPTPDLELAKTVRARICKNVNHSLSRRRSQEAASVELPILEPGQRAEAQPAELALSYIAGRYQIQPELVEQFVSETLKVLNLR